MNWHGPTEELGGMTLTEEIAGLDLAMIELKRVVETIARITEHVIKRFAAEYPEHAADVLPGLEALQAKLAALKGSLQ